MERLMWRGKVVDEMTREEAIEALYQAVDNLMATQGQVFELRQERLKWLVSGRAA